MNTVHSEFSSLFCISLNEKALAGNTLAALKKSLQIVTEPKPFTQHVWELLGPLW